MGFKSGLLIGGLVIAVVALGGYIALDNGDGSGRNTVEVPNVVGSTAQKATAKLKSVGLAVDASDAPTSISFQSLTGESVYVSRQTPAEGTQAPPDATVTLYFDK